MELAGYFRLEPDRIVRHDGRTVSLSRIDEVSAYWDPALGEERGTPDWSCCAVVGRDRQGYFYVLDCYLAQYDQPEEQVRAIADLLWRWGVPKCGIEANGFQSLLISDLREAMAQKCLEEQTLDWSCLLVPVQNTKSKVLRINALQPMVANQWLWFADHLPAEAIRQRREFRPVRDSGKDDFPDAVEGAIRVSKGMIDRRSSGG